MENVNLEQIEKAVKEILIAVGEDPNRDGLLDTPKRVAKMYKEMFAGLHEEPGVHLEKIFEEEHEDVVLVKDIPFHSMCEHHLVPFYGKAHIAYIPKNGKITGLSKFARLLESVAKRPQVQERITQTVANLIEEKLDAAGVFVVIQAEHMCMSMRGIKKQGSNTVTIATRGLFEQSKEHRDEVLALIKL